MLVKSLSNPAAKVAAVSLLGGTGHLKWQQTDAGIEVALPDRKPCEYAYALKISGDSLNAPSAE